MLSLSLTTQVLKKAEIANKSTKHYYLRRLHQWEDELERGCNIISQGEVTKKLKRRRDLQRVLINVLMKISPRVTAHILIVTFYSSGCVYQTTTAQQSTLQLLPVTELKHSVS